MVYGSRTCFVPGCSTGYRKTVRENSRMQVKNKSLFKPRNEAQLEKWRKAVHRTDRVLSRTNTVCELHFLEEDIIRYYETVMPDGTVHRIDRGVPQIKPDAVPCVFPSMPKSQKKRKPPKPREHPKDLVPDGEKRQGETTSVDVGVDNMVLLAEVASGTAAAGEEVTKKMTFDFEGLLKDIPNIKMPSSNWGTAIVGKNLVFMCVGSNFYTEKTLIISETMQVKALFNGKEAYIGTQEVNSLEQLTDLIKSINGLHICEGMSSNERSTQCTGYIPIEWRLRGQGPSNRCLPCHVARKAVADKRKKGLLR